MNTKISSLSLWWIFAIAIFLLTLLFGALMSFIVISLHRAGLLNFERRNFIMPMLPFFMTSVSGGALISLFVGKMLLTPITHLVNATKEVARGDFSIRLSQRTPIAEVSEMYGNFNRMVQELGGIETLRNDFVVNVSHEFKTPLTSIEGYATLLQNDSLSDEDRREYSRLIIESTKKLSNLTSNILQLSKLETQEIAPKRHSFLLDEQIRQALLLLEPQWSKKQLELDIEMPTVRFFGSEELLFQVWLNILSNAVKFTPNGGKITVGMELSANSVSVKISDTGCGISEDIQKHIFEKFYQGDSARAVEGNGLGLALVYKIVSLCAGDVRVESEPGNGATFTVSLPITNITNKE